MKIKTIMLFLFGLFALTPSTTAWAAANFCWKDSYGRGVGSIPGRVADCPKSYTNNGLTCGRGTDDLLKGYGSRLASCPKGYTNNGLTCGRGSHDLFKGYSKSKLAKCPRGYTNMGLDCQKGSNIFKRSSKMTCPKGYFMGAAKRCYKTCPKGYTQTGVSCHRPVSTLSAKNMTCPKGYFKSSITARCHRDCPKGYANTGETCHRPVSTLGMASMVCNSNEVKKGPRCYPKSGACGSKEYDAGLCYTRCKPGYSGVGPVCWGQPPKGWVQCGMGAAKSSEACAGVVFGQVTSVGSLALTVATFGGSAAAKSAVSAPQKAAQLSKMKQKFAQMKKAFEKIQDSPKIRKSIDAYKNTRKERKAATAGYGFGQVSNNDEPTAEDMARVSAQIAAIVDSSGVSDTVAAYTYAKCGKVNR